MKFSLTPVESFVNQKILELFLDNQSNIQKEWVDIRAIPEDKMDFDGVWNDFIDDNFVR